jgi:hypothetical protein
MHLVRTALLLSLVACSGSSKEDNDPFATFEACFTEHHDTEAFPIQQAIVICCISHPIGNAPVNTVCGADAASCQTYVTANLMGSDAGSGDISAACADYVSQRGM